MNYRYIGLIGMLIVALSCQSIDKEQLAREYYQALDESNLARIAELQYDSIRVKEGPFTTTYTVKEYVNWLKWDSVFHPTYKIVEAKVIDDGVELTISKVCQRIAFLNGGPMISKEELHFKEGKIYDLEIKEFIEFDGEQWNAKRGELVSWIDLNHPELNGFINDQSLQGGLNYKKALELFANRSEPQILPR